jgi:hypothetical protein
MRLVPALALIFLIGSFGPALPQALKELPFEKQLTLARVGDVDAQFEVGLAYETGAGGKADEAEAAARAAASYVASSLGFDVNSRSYEDVLNEIRGNLKSYQDHVRLKPWHMKLVVQLSLPLPLLPLRRLLAAPQRPPWLLPWVALLSWVALRAAHMRLELARAVSQSVRLASPAAWLQARSAAQLLVASHAPLVVLSTR